MVSLKDQPMSKDTNNAQTPDERPGDGAAEIRAFRFEFRHALAFSVISIVFTLGAGAVLSLGRFGAELFAQDAALNALPSTFERSAYRPLTEQRSNEKADAAANSSPRTKTDEEERREKQRAEAERELTKGELTKVFAAVDRSDPSKMRKFLKAYRDDPLAQELGYIDAVKRSVSERRLFGPDAIVACDDCWCLREVPASVKASTVTQ